MARIRTIKPEFFTSEDIVALSPLTRLFYISLWCEADRDGLLNWKPKTLKLRYFPGDDNAAFNQAVDELLASDLVITYEVDGKQYAQIPKFTQHQVINNRESLSIIPKQQEQNEEIDASGTRESGVQGEGKGRERKGKEGNSRATALPRDFSINESMQQWAIENKITVDLVIATDKWKDYILANGKKYVDWVATWRNGMKKAQEWHAQQSPGNVVQFQSSPKANFDTLAAGMQK